MHESSIFLLCNIVRLVTHGGVSETPHVTWRVTGGVNIGPPQRAGFIVTMNETEAWIISVCMCEISVKDTEETAEENH